MSHFNHKGRPGLVGGSLPKNNLQTLFSILKGSSTSGNYGHQGRPGIKGGSSPGGGHAKIGINTSGNIKSQIESHRANKKSEQSLGKDTDFYNKEWLMKNKLHDKSAQKLSNYLGISIDASKALVGKAFSYKDEDTGYNTGIDEFYIFNDRVIVVGTIYNSEGDEIGAIQRSFYPDKTISHDLFKFEDKSNQGSGFGSRFYEHAEKTYKQAGIKEVHLQANIDVGGYAWARMGFDFSSNAHEVKIKDKFSDAYKSRYGFSIAKIPDTAYEMASFVGPDGHRFGKEVMLGTAWNGYKKLEDSDLGYQVGQAYYKNKKGKK